MADAQGNQAKVAQLGDMGAAISFISNQLDLAGPGVGALLAGPEGVLRQLCDAVNFRDPAPRCLEKGYLRTSLETTLINDPARPRSFNFALPPPFPPPPRLRMPTA